MPDVSVIIPAYNPGIYLDEALQSVISQTFTDWECIVVDDGSREDLSRIEEMDPRVHLIHQSNSGVAIARNRGFAKSIGRYIALLDGDDAWHTNKLAEQVAFLDANQEIMECHTGCEMIDQFGNRIGSFPPAAAIDYFTMFHHIPPIPSSALVRRCAFSLVGGFDPCFQGSEDFDFFLKIALVGKLVGIERPLTRYRRHDSNMSANYRRMWHDHMAVLDKHYHRALARHDQKCAVAIRVARVSCARRWGEFAYETARCSMRRRALVSTLRHGFWAVWWNPRHTVRSLARLPWCLATK